MPSFLSRGFSAKKGKDSQKVSESVSTSIPSSPSRFRLLPSRSASRPPSSSSAVDGGSSKMRGLLSRTPPATRTGSRAGENSQTAARKQLSPSDGAVDGGVIGSRVHDRPVSPKNSKPSQLPVPIRGHSPQRVNSPPGPQRGPPQANRPTSPFPPSRTFQQDYQQQLRRSTASPSIPSRGPSRGPSPYHGPYPSLHIHNQWPTSFNPIDNAENFNMADFYSRQGTPILRNPSRNSTRAYPRSQSMTSESGHSPEDFVPPSPRSLKGPHLDPGERRSSHNMRNSTNNIDSVMLGNRGPGGMGMGMGMAGIDGGLNPNMGPGNMQRRGGNIPPIPRIPSMYKPSAQSVRNQNQMLNSNNYSQYPPAFRSGKPRNNQDPDSQRSPQFSDFEGPSQYPVGRGQPPRMQSPRPFQPPHRPHSAGPRGPDMRPPPQDRHVPKKMNENVTVHPNPEIPLRPTPDNSSATDSVNLTRKPDPQQSQQPMIPTALPTPSLTPTPPSRSNSSEERQNSDVENVHVEGLEISNRSRPPSEVNLVQTYKPWQESGQNHGYFRRPPPYQRIDPQHNTSPPSPISAPETPVTASSASSTHGNSNHVIAQQIQLSTPIMPGPVKEICYTKDINLVMEECMMGHGKTGRDSVMRRTANWQHRVGCMMCGDYGGPGGEKVESGPTMAGKHWLWLCSWCALRVCADCRCRLAEEEDHLREKGGSVGTLKVNLKALREKIIEEKNQEQEQRSTGAVEGSLFEETPKKLVNERMDTQQVSKEALRAEVELPPVKIEGQKTQNVLSKKADVLWYNTAPTTISQRRAQSPSPFAVQHNRPSAMSINTTVLPSLAVSTSSEESVNSFATAGSHVESSGSQKEIGAVEVHKEKMDYPPRVSSRNLASVPNKEPVLPSLQTAAELKEEETPDTPKPLPVPTSTRTGTNGSTNTTIIVSSIISPPKSPESPSQKPLRGSATVTSTAPQTAATDAHNMGTMASSDTFAQAIMGDSSLRAVVSPEMLALITGIPVAQQRKAATAASEPTPAVPAKSHSLARDLTVAFAPPPVSTKSPPPPRQATVSPPPQSSSSVLLSPIVQAKPPLPTMPPTLQARNNTVKRKPVPPSPSSASTVEKFLLPPLSFESEISNEIDTIFGTRQYTAPKTQATHAEEVYKQEAVESSPKGGRRWYRGLFGGRK